MPTKADLEAELEWTEKGLAEWRDIAIRAIKTIIHNYDLYAENPPTTALGKQVMANLREPAIHYKDFLKVTNENN
jgi:hypothetical protein